MTKRTLLAGVLGGIAMFIWTSIAHMALPLGEAGIREIPNEQAVLAAMQANIGDKSALYLFPGFGLGQNPTRQQQRSDATYGRKNCEQSLRHSYVSPAWASARHG